MSPTNHFPGFPREIVEFYIKLRTNNTKAWFNEHRRDYDDYVMGPARNFVSVMGERLRKIVPTINAIPRVDKSIFRIHRDVRFSKDKSPFKTHLGVWFWDGDGPKMESSGFYFHLEPPTVMLGAGIYQFTKDLMPEYRDSVVHPVHGPALKVALDPIMASGKYTLGGTHYKRTPHGFDPEHENVELLLHNGFHLGIETPIPNAFFSEEILDYCLTHFQKLLPVHQWLAAMTNRTQLRR